MKPLYRHLSTGCCLGAALAALGAGVARGQERPRAVAVEYGVYAGGLGVFNSTFQGTTPATTRLRAATSLSGRVFVDLESRLAQPARNVTASFRARLTGLGGNSFYGFGNRSTAREPSAYYSIERYQLTVAPALTFSTAGGITLSGGPVLKYTSSESRGAAGLQAGGETARGMLAATQPYGAGRFKQAGIAVAVHLGTPPSSPGNAGLRLELGGSAYPAVLDVASPFGEAHAEVSGFARVPVPASPTLALRVGAKRVLGTAPFHEAAYVGGSSSLRGFRSYRFAGDASLYAGAELRFRLGDVALFGRRVRYGVLGLADAARVYVDGASPGGWHTAMGGGVWVEPLGMQPVSVAVARGAEGARLHIGVGFPF